MNTPTKLNLCALHTHTTLSILDGASSIQEYLDYSKEIGAKDLGVTDHGYVIGAMELYTKAKKEGIVPLPGCEFYLTPDKDYTFVGRSYEYYHITVWAVNEKGYRNLLKLGSLSWNQDELWGYSKSKTTGQYSLVTKPRVIKRFQNEKPRITFDELIQYGEGLVIGSGCILGPIAKAYLNNEPAGAKRNLEKLLSEFRGRMYIELMSHDVTHNWDREKKGFIKNPCTDFSPDGNLQKSCNLKLI